MINDIANELLCMSAACLMAISYTGNPIHASLGNLTDATTGVVALPSTEPVKTISTLKPTFQWTAPAGSGLVYELIVCEGKTERHGYWIAGKMVHRREGITTTSYTLEKPLAPCTIYVWSVRTRSGNRTSKWAQYLDRDWSRLQSEPCQNDILWPFKTPDS